MYSWKLILNKKSLCITDEYILAFKWGYLYLISNKDDKCVLKKKKIGTFKNYFSFLSRLLRLEPRCAIKLDEQRFLLSYKGAIYNYNVTTNELVKEHSFKKGMNNPLSFCSFYESTNKKRILYGEYFWNSEKGPVSIYERYDSEWKIVYKFKSGEITHIHNIIYDNIREKFIILTGDSDNESGIWMATKDFSEVKPILIGSQQFRSCVAFPMKDGIVFVTDTPLETNYAYYIKLGIDDSPVIEKLSKIPGPCIFGGKIGHRMFFSTSVEPDSSLNKIRYHFTKKPGKGNVDAFSYLFEVKNDGSLIEIIKFRKDALPLWLFQFGNIIFPENETDSLIINTQSLKPKHGVTIEVVGG